MSYLDPFFLFITDLHKNKFAVTFILCTLGISLLFKNRKRAIFWLVSIAVIVSSSDFIGGQIIKPSFERLRPPMVLNNAVVRAPHFGGYSFTSNHASNIFCLATLLSSLFFSARFAFFFFAFLVAYSRVYNGVHFPSDVIAGAILGISIGMLGLYFIRALERKIWSEPQVD